MFNIFVLLSSVDVVVCFFGVVVVVVATNSGGGEEVVEEKEENGLVTSMSRLHMVSFLAPGIHVHLCFIHTVVRPGFRPVSSTFVYPSKTPFGSTFSSNTNLIEH